MKVLSSLKSAKTRGDAQVIRRGKTVLVIDKKNPKFKAKQGTKK
jgi:large subunit ribosomal protein L36